MRALGRYQIEDTRDVLYKSTSTPRTWRYWSTGPWSGNQGSIPACVGFAWSHWLASSPCRQWLAPFGLYYLAQTHDEWEGTDYAGTSVRGGAKGLHKLGLVSGYRWARNASDVANAILTTGPVVVGTLWSSDMTRAHDGVLEDRAGRNEGGHAYLVYGVNLRRGMFRIKNSWGKSWGINGTAWMSFDLLDDLIRDNGEACIAIEHMGTPKTS